MKRIKARSYKSGSSKLRVSFSPTAIASQVKEACTICGGEIEESPMMRGVCYSCYSGLVSSPETFQALKQKVEEKTTESAYTAMDKILGTEPATQQEMESMIDLFTGGQNE